MPINLSTKSGLTVPVQGSLQVVRTLSAFDATKSVLHAICVLAFCFDVTAHHTTNIVERVSQWILSI